MTTKTTKEDAENVIKAITDQFNGKKWFKKAVLSADDHGWALSLYINKNDFIESGEKLPHQTSIKVCIFNV